MSVPCLFASDLHGSRDRVRRLLSAAEAERPAAVFLGGDLLPGGTLLGETGFLGTFLLPAFLALRARLGSGAPRVLLIPGNDDPAAALSALEDGEAAGAWELLHGRKTDVFGHAVYGYACVPPTPFRLKDWERYDVSRYVDPGAVAPEDGLHSAPCDARELRLATIAGDLARLTGGDDLSGAVLLLHAPPYRSLLDRADLDGRTIEHVPLDPHVGSIAVRRLVEERQPLLTLHGHVHESARLTGSWREVIGRTVCLSAAHDGPELALVRVDLDAPASASRELL